MGNHKKWRSLAKKMRRKRLRQKIAEEREEKLIEEQLLREQSPRYRAMLAEQEALDKFQLEEEDRQQLMRHQQWLINEAIAQKQFVERQKRLAHAREQKIQQDNLIREEWDAEQSKLRAIEELATQEKEEKKFREELLMKQIDEFIKRGDELPPGAKVSSETRPDKEPCPFFSKTGTCRFGDNCSRNHARPGISKVLLIPSFYTHFGLEQSTNDECNSDLMLEYEESEKYSHFKEFFDDVLPEFQTCGDVTELKVCCNGEPHLRGNVYVEYSKERYAVKAYQKFHGRYYGGKQLRVEFTCIKSWKLAVCGLFFKKRCPKGRNCNFLHVFRNPYFAFLPRPDSSRQRQQQIPRGKSRCQFRTPASRSASHRSPLDGRNWRWSESPERSVRGNKTDGRRENKSPQRKRERDWEMSCHSRDRGASDRTIRTKDLSNRTDNSTNSSKSKPSHRKERKRKHRSRSRSK